MSIKSQINSIRREIQNDKIDPVQALNQATELFSDLLKQLNTDSIAAYVNDLWGKYHNLSTSSTIRYDNMGHNKQWFDAQIREFGNLLAEMEKRMKKETK